MISKVVGCILEEQSKRQIISEEDISVYQYGYTLMLEVLINMVISAILGLVMGELRNVVFFILMFMPLRSYCGGYHAPKAWICVILSNIVIAGAALAAKYLEFKTGYAVLIMAEIVSTVAIVFFAPMQSETKQLNHGEVQKYKKYGRRILGAELLFALLIFVVFGTNKYGIVIVLAHIVQAGSLLSGYMKKKWSGRTV